MKATSIPPYRGAKNSGKQEKAKRTLEWLRVLLGTIQGLIFCWLLSQRLYVQTSCKMPEFRGVTHRVWLRSTTCICEVWLQLQEAKTVVFMLVDVHVDGVRGGSLFPLFSLLSAPVCPQDAALPRGVHTTVVWVPLYTQIQASSGTGHLCLWGRQKATLCQYQTRG